MSIHKKFLDFWRQKRKDREITYDQFKEIVRDKNKYTEFKLNHVNEELNNQFAHKMATE